MKLLLLSDANSVHTQKWVKGLIAMEVRIAVFSLQAHDGVFYSQFSEDQLILKSAALVKRSTELGKAAYLKAVPAVRRLVREFSPDLVHAHYATSYGLLGALSGFKPLIISVWGSDVFDFPEKSFLHRFLLKKILAKSTLIASTSECMATRVAHLVGNSMRIAITPFGVDLMRFSPNQMDSVSGNSLITIGTVKTMHHHYGIDTLIRAFAVCKKKIANLPEGQSKSLRLLIAGDGPDILALRILCQDLGIGEFTDFIGSVPNSEVPAILARIDVFVALSRKESFGVAVVEASAMAIPVVVSDVGGLPEVVLNRKSGIVVPVDNPEAAATAIMELVENPDLRSQYGKAGRIYVSERYSESHCNNVMFALYQSLVDAVPK